jgi:hypothetical protein
MKINTISQLTRGLLLTSLLALTVCRLGAVDLNLGTNMPPITFHGFVSQGFLATTKYNYLGSDTKNGSFKFFEAGLNAAINPFPRTRITAQAFMFDVGEIGRYDAVLDYAQIDYTFNDLIGLRAGRIRRSQGIYNHIVDLDLARTWILLPQGIYDPRWRDFYASLDGGEIFGNLSLKKGGSLSYEIFGGVERPTTRGGLATTILNQLPPGSTFDSINSPHSANAQLWWDTPLDGFRVGAAYHHVFDAANTFTLNLPPPPFGPGPMKAASGDVTVRDAQFSLEYLWKAWTFQAEYRRDWISFDAQPSQEFDSWYAAVAHRFNHWFEAGTYYSEYYGNVHDRSGSKLPNSSDGFQKDVALSLRFDPKDWWIIKLEGHYIRGTALLQDNAANPVRNDDGWFMLAVKTTFSF